MTIVIQLIGKRGDRIIKIRSLKEALIYIRSLDEKTGISKNALRMLFVSGKIPSVKVGNYIKKERRKMQPLGKRNYYIRMQKKDGTTRIITQVKKHIVVNFHKKTVRIRVLDKI